EQRFGVEVRGVRVEAGRCTGVLTADGELAARWVVNAAGAWAGRVGTLAGAVPIALVPHRRTIVTFAAPVDVRAWPLVPGRSRRRASRPADARGRRAAGPRKAHLTGWPAPPAASAARRSLRRRRGSRP